MSMKWSTTIKPLHRWQFIVDMVAPLSAKDRHVACPFRPGFYLPHLYRLPFHQLECLLAF
jgi:hypothetical protein